MNNKNKQESLWRWTFQFSYFIMSKIINEAKCQRLTLVILEAWKAAIRRITVQGKPKEIV
jgi:hypothetical protein